MTLNETIAADLTAAMKAKDATRLSALRMLKAAVTNKGMVEKGRDLEDAEVLQVVASLVKQRRDSIEQFSKAGRTDLVDKESAELKVLEAYLPQRLGADEIAAEVAKIVAELGASGPGDMGKVMGAAKSKLAGKADMGLVSAAVKQALSK